MSGIRRRGYTPEAIRNFVANIGVTKTNGTIELAMLEHFVREDLNRRAQRVMAVLRPLKVVIDNYPEGQTEEMDAVNNPEDASAGTRKVPFSRELYIEQDDFREVPPKGYFRLSPERKCACATDTSSPRRAWSRTRRAKWLRCTCTYDPATRGGNAPDGRKVKATIHWVSAAHAIERRSAALRQPVHQSGPERRAGRAGLHRQPEPEFAGGGDRTPSSSLRWQRPQAGARYQFERLGYFCVDPDSKPGALVFNRTVALKDAWARKQTK